MIRFYVSGHGYGHATRTAAVISAILHLAPGTPVQVRTSAPQFLFPAGIEYLPGPVEPQVVESADALSVDGPASAEAIAGFAEGLPGFVEAEAVSARRAGVGLIAADIPFTAGLVARAADLASVAIGNFTWDWIFAETPEARPWLALVREGYACFGAALRLPLSHADGWEGFRKVEDVPLVAPRAARPREAILRDLGLQGETRPIVLIGGRAALNADALSSLQTAGAGYVFLHNRSLPDFHELVRAADAVVSKIGYSIAAECIAEGTALLYPPRTGFREEKILADGAPRHTRALPIPYADWSTGNWQPYLEAVLQLPAPVERLQTDGAAIVAERLLRIHEAGRVL